MTAMKCLYVLGVVALIGVVRVNGDGNSGESSEDNGFGSSEERGRCYCQAAGRRTAATCSGATATQVIGCPNTNSFRQCTGTACAVTACSTGQVWNVLKNACSVCDADKHVSADLQVCVCNRGNTLNPTTQTCVACPTAATIEDDRCFCPSTLARDTTNNICKPCPLEAPMRNSECMCSDSTLFFDQTTWTCKTCPGTLIPPRRGNGRSSCRCTGANQIFNEKNATCYTCPSGTTSSSDNEECNCARNSGLRFNYVTGACACKTGYTLNPSGVCAIGT